MSVRSLRRAADNRAEAAERAINAERSLRAKVRRAVEWVMSESKRLNDHELQQLTEQVKQIARDWNERSRP